MRRVGAIPVAEPVEPAVFCYKPVPVEDADEVIGQTGSKCFPDETKRHRIVLVVAGDVPVAIDFDITPRHFSKSYRGKNPHQRCFIRVKTLASAHPIGTYEIVVDIVNKDDDRFVEFIQTVEDMPIEIAEDTAIGCLHSAFYCGFILRLTRSCWHDKQVVVGGEIRVTAMDATSWLCFDRPIRCGRSIIRDDDSWNFTEIIQRLDVAVNPGWHFLVSGSQGKQ